MSLQAKSERVVAPASRYSNRAVINTLIKQSAAAEIIYTIYFLFFESLLENNKVMKREINLVLVV